MNYDPDRSLWLPSRRKFFFLGLAAGVAPFLPDVPKPTIYAVKLSFWHDQSVFNQLFVGPGDMNVDSVYVNGAKLKPSQYMVDGNRVTIPSRA